MDDFLSPKRAAKVKAKCGKLPVQSDTDDLGEDQNSDPHDIEEDTEEESSENQELSQASDHAPTAGCRRSSRKLSKDVPNYDLRYVLSPLLTVLSGRHSTIDNVELGSIPPLIRLCVQLLPELR